MEHGDVNGLACRQANGAEKVHWSMSPRRSPGEPSDRFDERGDLGSTPRPVRRSSSGQGTAFGPITT
jgi:hypothetical protein